VVALRNPGEPADEIVDGVAVFRLPMSHTQGAGVLATTGEYIGFAVLASAKVAMLIPRRRYQVIHVHNPPDFLVLTAVVPRLFGARVIFDIHDFAPELFATRFMGKPAALRAEPLVRLFERLATRFATAVITAHETYRRQLEARGLPPEKITVVFNSLDERLLPKGPGPAEDDGFRVVYHGTVTPHYGIELLIEAAALVARDEPQLKVEIYGDGDALEQVRARAQGLGIADRVYLSGCFLPQQEVLHRVRSASAGVISNLPTRWAAAVTPTKLFEYAALGVPIVAPDLPGIREQFSSDEVRFFAPGDASALAEALRDVARNPDTAVARAEAAARRSYEYRWALCGRRYVELLERLSRAA
jgi:glycosyltransferase involved in cell wall biosynthesis